jgi:hypothetical protein
MVRRVFWVALGATAGVLVVRQVTRTAKSLTPGSLADRASGMAGGLTSTVREFLDDVRDNAQRREYELYEALGVEQPAELEAASRATGGRPDDED